MPVLVVFCGLFEVEDVRGLGCMVRPWNQWPFQDPEMEVPTIYKAYIRPICKGISPENMAKNMVQYLHFRILEFPLMVRSTCSHCRSATSGALLGVAGSFIGCSGSLWLWKQYFQADRVCLLVKTCLDRKRLESARQYTLYTLQMAIYSWFTHKKW
jgi:hypothetical protein